MYTAGIENVVKVWDLRKEEVSMTLKGHSDTVTGMSVSPDGTHLLTNAMDNTLRVRLPRRTMWQYQFKFIFYSSIRCNEV